MSIYLPIAEIPIDIFLLLALGGLGGVLAGLFGIGGGFLITPLLIFIGIPPYVAVATSANQILASSLSGFLAHLRRQNVDIKMGIYLLIGGFVGSTLGVWLFSILKDRGQIDLVISLTYVFFLGLVGALMAIESGRTIWRRRYHPELAPVMKKTGWLQGLRLPFIVSFPRSSLEISVLIPIAIGLVAGALVSLMGIGGGFVMIPAMIYLLGMPTSVVVGTSLFQIIFTSANVTILQAMSTQSVDIVLALILIVGGVIGAQIGSSLSLKLPAEKLRLYLAVMIFLLAIRLAYGLFVEPEALYSIEPVLG